MCANRWYIYIPICTYTYYVYCLSRLCLTARLIAREPKCSKPLLHSLYAGDSLTRVTTVKRREHGSARVRHFKHEKILGKPMRNLSRLTLVTPHHSITHDTHHVSRISRDRRGSFRYFPFRVIDRSRESRSVIGRRYRSRSNLGNLCKSDNYERKCQLNYSVPVSIKLPPPLPPPPRFCPWCIYLWYSSYSNYFECISYPPLYEKKHVALFTY